MDMIKSGEETLVQLSPAVAVMPLYTAETVTEPALLHINWPLVVVGEAMALLLEVQVDWEVLSCVPCGPPGPSGS